MPFITVKPDNSESSHACFYPAEKEARNTPGSRVVYVGVRGQSVCVWPLAPLPNTEPAEVEIVHEPEPYL